MKSTYRVVVIGEGDEVVHAVVGFGKVRFKTLR